MTKKIFFTAIFAFLLFLPLEVTSRLYWVKKAPLSFWAPEPMYLFYPALKPVHETAIYDGDGYYDILFLGGSVLYEAGKMDHSSELLREKLKKMTDQPVRIHNVARPSHSTRDSLFKYRFLHDKQFDLVILYDAINEVRANNCPPDLFNNDYSHYSWYRKLNYFEHDRWFKISTLPYTLFCLWTDIQEKFKWVTFVPTDIPRDNWVCYGRTVKTVKPFRDNVNAILALARQRGDPVLLSTFAFYVPRDYTYFKFRTHQLDYAAHTFYIEVWGEPEAVMLGILKHNQVIRQIAAEDPGVIFLDEFTKMTKGKLYFDDICHLTDKGHEKLLNDFAEAVSGK